MHADICFSVSGRPKIMCAAETAPSTKARSSACVSRVRRGSDFLRVVLINLRMRSSILRFADMGNSPEPLAVGGVLLHYFGTTPQTDRNRQLILKWAVLLGLRAATEGGADGHMGGHMN